MCPESKENNWNRFNKWKDDNYDLAKQKVPKTFSELDNEILDSGNWRMKYEGAGNDSSEYRHASLREIKRQSGIPMIQQPINQKMVPLTDANGNWILNGNKQPVMTRELTYDINGKKIVIQDHSAGHNFGEGGIGDQPSHHNVRPFENTRTGKVEGMKDHYYFDNRNSK